MNEKQTSMRRALMSLVALFPLWSRHAAAKTLLRQPVFLPFAVAKRGAVLSFDFEATESSLYTVILIIAIKENDAEDLRRIMELGGDGGYDPKTHKRLNTGLPIPIKLRIDQLNPSGEFPTYEKTIVDEELQSRSTKELVKVVDRIDLSRGSYRIRVEALSDIPELSTTSIKFGIYIRRL
jgi:hypothetical protein